MFDISMSGLMAGIIFGLLGMYIFREGKKESDWRILFIGLALMIYPYFTQGPLEDWGIGIGLCGAAYYLRYR